MLTIRDGRVDRRAFLRIGSLALGGCAIPSCFSAADAAEVSRLSRGKSVIFLFLHGGPSQIETFDPKMTAPLGIRSETGEVATSIPGVTFGGTFPQLAARADRLAIVRSFTTGDGIHNLKPLVCRDTADANLGSFYSRVVGTNHPVTGMPTNAALFPRAVDPSTQPGTRAFGLFESSGGLGAGYAPFVPGAGGNLQRDMELRLPLDRLEDRRTLLSGLDRLRYSFESTSGLDQLREQAFSTILGGVSQAFDLTREDPALVARYDTAPLARPEAISRRWNNYNNYVDNAKSLGKLLLLARRLCETGCGFVTVTTNFVWDMHADVNNVGLVEGMGYMGRPLDHAVTTLLDDIESRGLSDKILLVVAGEMGRTPRVNARGGRDHWGNLAPLLLSGGGLNMGQVIGQSTRDAGEPATEPMRIPNLVSTILHTLFDVGQLRVARSVPTQIVQAATEVAPIPGLV